MKIDDSVTFRDVFVFVLVTACCIITAPVSIPIIVWKYCLDNKDQK